MARATAIRTQAKALRALADELEAGRRTLSPELVGALARELEGDDLDPVTAREWQDAWAAEIDRRLEEHRAGRTKKRDLGAVLEELRGSR